MKNFSLISIVTPSLNQGHFIEDTILSVKNQDYPNIEHLIIDGNSNDNTIEILKKYEGTYNMQWISERDKGQADAVNKGLGLAKGEIIGWLNSDDVYFDKYVLQAVIETFFARPDVDVVYGDVASISDSGKILRIICVPRFSYERLLRDCYLDQPAVFFRRKVVEQHNLNTCLQCAMDYEFWLRIGKEYRFYHLSRILAGDRHYLQRKMIVLQSKLKEESEEASKEYGRPDGINFYVRRYFDMLFSGGPRRLKGLMNLVALNLVKPNLAFRGKLTIDLSVVWKQLFPRKLRF